MTTDCAVSTRIIWTCLDQSLLFCVVRQQTEAGYQEEGWESDSVEDPKDGDETKNRRGEKRAALLRCTVSRDQALWTYGGVPDFQRCAQ